MSREDITALELSVPDKEGNRGELNKVPGSEGVRDCGERMYDKEGNLLYGDEF